jgi:hypothetical protein
MIRVTIGASDPITAWRVRDALASHPVLGGAASAISVGASHDRVVVEGWILDADLQAVATRLARRAAGARPVLIRLQVYRCAAGGPCPEQAPVALTEC